MEEFLKETQLVDYRNEKIQKLVEERGWKELGEFDKIKQIYNFVKDEIKLGFNAMDAIPASKVLGSGYGQCNTKATLLMALLRAVGIPCRLHAFTVDKSMQAGIVTWIVYKYAPKRLLHSWAEVYYAEKWVALEGVIVDSAYLSKLQKFYGNCRGAFSGFCVATENLQDPAVEWKGEDTYIQSKSIVEDLGVYNSPDELFENHKQEYSGFKEFCYKFAGRHLMNRNVRRMRKMKDKTKKKDEAKPAEAEKVYEAAETQIENKTEA